MMKNTSALDVSDFRFTGSSVYMCLVMNKQQCVSSHPVLTFTPQQVVYHSVEESVVLHCTDFNDDQPPVWIKEAVKGTSNSTVVGHDYSLVFSSLTLNHSGVYTCEKSDNFNIHLLFVCPKFGPPAVVFFSEGEDVTLRCRHTEDLLNSWFIKSNQTEGRVVNVNLLMPDEGSRIRLSYPSPDISLVLSNVTPEDTGEYWCAVMDRDNRLYVNIQIPSGAQRAVWDLLHSLYSEVFAALRPAADALCGCRRRKTRTGEQFSAV